MLPVKGQWISPDGKLYRDRVIPVKIAATREQFQKIIQITIKHYNQLAVMGYKVSDEVFIVHRDKPVAK